MSCISASHSAILSQVELEERPAERRGSRAYQIFPETNTNEDLDSSSLPDDILYRRERLPSIVVEPTECSEVQPPWPPRCLAGNNAEEDDEEDSGTDNTTEEQQDDAGTEESSATRKSSIGPSPSLLSLSRLTPPSSPTPPEAAPPCLRS